MSETSSASLRDITLKIGSGATPRGGEAVYVEDGASFIRSQNVYDGYFSFDGLARISDEAARQLEGVTVQARDVLVCITGESVTRTCLVDLKALPARVSQHVAIVRADPAVLDPGYLLAALLNPSTKARMNLMSQAGATRRALTKSHLESLEIPLPPLDLQRGIAGVLGALSDLIDANQRLAVQCEVLASSLVWASPTRIPLGDVAAMIRGTVEPQGLVDHFSLPAFDSERSPERVQGETIKSRKTVLDSPVALVSRLNPRIPRVWMAYPAEGVPALASTEFVPLEGVGAPTEFVWAACNGEKYSAQMAGHVTGTTGSHQRVDKETLLRLEVPDPDSVSAAATDAVVALVREAHESRYEAGLLRRTRGELLPLLFSGRVLPGEVAG